MPLKLMYITNNPAVARLADHAGVDRIFVDLEILGKDKRQGHLNTVISRHSLEDVGRVKDALTSAQLLVRCDPINQDSKAQINQIIDAGADIIMLPMFKTTKEVTEFINIVCGRAKTCLLLETPQAMCRMDDILAVPGIDEVHIGLNDLHLGMGLDFMFELLSGGIVEYITGKLKSRGMFFGFGGIARIGYGALPSEIIVTEHYRLGSKMAILSRSFCDAYKLPIEEVEEIFKTGVKNIRDFEEKLLGYTPEQFEQNKTEMKRIIKTLIKQ